MNILILAGGLGSRFFARNSKISINFWGVSVLDMLCLNALKVTKNVHAVLRKDALVKLVDNVNLIWQKDEYGTGSAVQSYIESVENAGDVLVIPGDVPLIDHQIMKSFLEKSDSSDVLIGIMSTPEGWECYGRVIFENAEVQKIIEYKDHPEKTEYVNTGIIFLSKKVFHLINKIETNERGEKYLTNIIELCFKNGYKITAIPLARENAIGFNTIEEFHVVLNIAQKKWRKKAIESKAIFFDIDSIYLSYDTEFELGAVVEPYCRFLPGVKVGSYGLIKAFSCLENCYVNGEVGPFANIRSGAIEKEAQVGAFVEMNRSFVGKKSKIKHLSYLGDIKIGENVNIGAGSVICNYDGQNKHSTKVENNAFIGANSTIIAPLNIGENAFLAAGGLYNKDVAKDEFAIARSSQINKPLKNNLKK